MPTTFQIGKKGGGKTLLAMMRIEHELTKTRRSIVTNFPIRYERFRQYLIEKYGEDFGYKDRMLLLDTHQTAQFWLYYGVQEVRFTPFEEMPKQAQERERKRAKKEFEFLNRKAPCTWASSADDLLEGKYEFVPFKVSGRKHMFDGNGGEDKAPEEEGKKKDRRVFVPDFSVREGHPSVAYFLDEIHITFNSRKWTRTGEDCLYYISLERHFGDDQYLCTQCFGNVDKQMRDMGQEYVMCINQRKLPLSGTMGLGRRPGDFTATHYSEPPTSKQVEPIRMYGFSLDVDGIASCYTTVTASEFGLDDTADKAAKRQGKIPFSVFVIICFLGFLLLIGGIGCAAQYVITGGANHLSKKTATAYGLAAASTNAVPSVPEVQAVAHANAVRVSHDIGSHDFPPVYITGYAYDPKARLTRTYLSDGRTLLPHEFRLAGRETIIFEGRLVTFRPVSGGK